MLLFIIFLGVILIFKNLPLPALIREIKEDTGLAATIEKFFGIIEHAWNFLGNEVCCHTHEMNLIFKLNIKELKFGDTLPQKDEYVAFQWLPVVSLGTIDLRPLPLQSALAKWLESTDDHTFWSTMIMIRNHSWKSLVN